MLFSIYSMLKATPSVLATGWDSAVKQFGALQQATGSGDVLSMVVAAVQLLVLALPTAALIYSLIRFGRRIGTTVWKWSKPTPLRRLIGGLGTMVACGLLIYLWAPALPFAGGRSGPLFGPTAARFQPIQPGTRGTVFDAVGAPQPAWTTSIDPKTNQPPAVASPGPLDEALNPAASPAPAVGPDGMLNPSASPAPALDAPPTAQSTLEATVQSTPDATAGSLATPAATSVPASLPPVAVPAAAATAGATTSVSAPAPTPPAVVAPGPARSSGAAPTVAPVAPAPAPAAPAPAPAAPAPAAPTSRAIPPTWTPRPASNTPQAASSPASR
jgi:hypothetical protein